MSITVETRKYLASSTGTVAEALKTAGYGSMNPVVGLCRARLGDPGPERTKLEVCRFEGFCQCYIFYILQLYHAFKAPLQQLSARK